MRRLFGCPDIVSLTEKFLMARNFYRIFTENNPVMGDSKTFGIPEAKGLKKKIIIFLKSLPPDYLVCVAVRCQLSVNRLNRHWKFLLNG